jgi:hypothetical protein
MARALSDEGRQDDPVKVCQPVFRMPLHAEAEARRLAFEGFDEAVRRPGRDTEAALAHQSVPTQAVHFHDAFAGPCEHVAVGLDQKEVEPSWEWLYSSGIAPPSQLGQRSIG